MKENLLKIINHYGIMKQLKYIHTEYYELDEAIIDYSYVEDAKGCSLEREYKEHVAEEIADVFVMLKQFQHFYDIPDNQIKDIMEYKIDRQLKRIEEENNKYTSI